MLNLLAVVPKFEKEFQVWEEGSGFWMPPQASDNASVTDDLMSFIYYISMFFFVLIVALMVFFIIRYRRRREGEGPVSNIKHNTALELTWTIIPLIIVLIMFYGGFRGFVRMDTPPDNAVPIHVTGKKWSWTFEYPNGHKDAELHIEQGRPFKLTLTSIDVTHSLYIPAFRVKKDAVPGRYNTAWFQANRPGEYRLFCAEYCGQQHSDMVARVVVHPPGMFDVWLKKAADPGDLTLAQRGQRVFSGIGGCVSCHSSDGSAIRGGGPTFKNLWGSSHEVRLKDGSVTTITVNEDYVRESILLPNVKVRLPYDAIMNTYQGQLSDDNILALIEFIKSLSDNYTPYEELHPASQPASQPTSDAVPESGPETSPADQADPS